MNIIIVALAVTPEVKYKRRHMKYWPLDQLFWLSGEETVSLCDQKNVQMMSGRPNALVLKNYCNVVPSSIHLQ